ncbi:Coq4 family protein [Sphingomonas sp.]|uniref:Coq4 family protein n=1 Tax=Sphingomonas sp. TaxID=28214 RepID=UPI0035C84EAA
MAKLPPFPGTSGRRDWRTAFDAIRKLLANGDDTAQVFRIMRALNVGNSPENFARLIATEEGGRIAYDRVELARAFSDPAFVASFAPGTVGAAYRDFLESTGYSADGLVEVSKLAPDETDMAHPYAWFGRRVRDTHDIWHVLTGYKADEHLGEACLVAFSYAQVGGLGWALIASAASLKSLRETKGTLFAKAVWEGYRHGRAARWISGEDYLTLLHEPIEAARRRLGIREPVLYRRAQAELGEELASYMKAERQQPLAA